MRHFKIFHRIQGFVAFFLTFFLITKGTAQIIYDAGAVASVKAEKNFKRGIQYYQSEEYARAETVFSELCTYPQPHQRITISNLMYGKSLFKLAKYKEAIHHLRQFNQTYPQSRYIDYSKYTIGSAYYMLGNHVAAVREFLWLLDYARAPELALNAKLIANQLIDLSLKTTDIEMLIDEIPADNALGLLTLKLAEEQAQTGFSNKGINQVIDFMNTHPQSEFVKPLEGLVTRAKLTSSPGSGVKLGVILPLSGGYAEDGERILLGLKYALRSSKAAKDHEIQLVIKDSESKIVTAIKAAQNLANDESVIAVIGELESNLTAAIATVLDQHNIPLIAPTASQYGIASIGKNVFQANCDLNERGKQLAIYAVKELGLKAFATLGPADEYGKGMIDGFTSTIDNLGGTIIAQKWFYEGALNLSRQMRSIRALGFKQMDEDTSWRNSKEILLAQADYDTSMIPVTSIDAIFCPVYTDEIKYIGPQCASFNIQAQLLGGDYWHDLDVLRSNQRYVNGTVFTSDYYVAENDPAFRRFRADFRKEMKSDFGRFHAYGYDTMNVILSLLQNMNRISRQGLRDELEQVYQYDGIKGQITWRGNERINSNINILEFTNGMIKKVK
ncbi:penicillin-binding protein activator [candidate division KSB1 bacterium]|nr:penicillin-binding protein activator [candidate division KSB1 bacterium]